MAAALTATMPSSTEALGIGLVVAMAVAALAVRWVRRRHATTAAASAGLDRNSQSASTPGRREIEPRVAAVFRVQGYQVLEAARDRPRGAGEMTVRRDRENFVVQWRDWDTSKVGIESIQVLQRAIARQGAAGGFALTKGRFGRDATAIAAACNVRLIDGPALRGLLAKAKAARRGAGHLASR